MRREKRSRTSELRRDRAQGFSLMELMVTVTIIGLLASVAIPGFMQYQRRSRSVEVYEALEKIAAGAKVFFDTPRVTSSGATDQLLPPSTGKTPAMTLGAVCATGMPRYPDTALTDFDKPEWVNLLFRPGPGFRYRYEWFKSSDDAGVARAEGDLDCDSTLSLLEIYLKKGAPGEPLQREGVFWVMGSDTE